jgi:glycosyltransferase involved in cell wall biosynthesis
MPTISVIIPCYNRATLVGETIQNMLDQTLPPDEIIVVDDGSTDNSADIVSSFGGIVRLIRQTNQGPGAARNAGIKAAKGEFIQLMDSDDLASLNKLEVQMKALQRSGADFAYCPWAYSFIENRSIRFMNGIIQTGPVPTSKPLLEWFISEWSLVFQNCLFRRSILEKTGLFRTDMMPSEDSEYFTRIFLSGASHVHTPECLVFYREHNHNKITQSGTSNYQRTNDWTYCLKLTGSYLGSQLQGMKLLTKIALLARVQSHLEFCAKHKLPGLPADHPYIQLSSPVYSLLAKTYKLYIKILRSIKGTPYYSPAYSFKKVGTVHKNLVVDMGYEVE